jgi:hypothetical protein
MLLRCHEGGRAEDRPCAGELHPQPILRACDLCLVGRLAPDGFGDRVVAGFHAGGPDQTEVDDAHPPAAADHDVLGFEIAVDEARSMRSGQPFSGAEKYLEDVPALSAR